MVLTDLPHLLLSSQTSKTSSLSTPLYIDGIQDAPTILPTQVYLSPPAAIRWFSSRYDDCTVPAPSHGQPLGLCAVTCPLI